MDDLSSDPQEELDDLIAAADPSVVDLIDGYEPVEALYRSAVSPQEIYPEASNTTGLPRALVVNASSAR